MRKKIIMLIIILVLGIVDFSGYIYIEAEDLKKEITTIKNELGLKYDEAILNYLYNKKLISTDDLNFLQQKNSDVKLATNDTKTLQLLKEDKVKLAELDRKLIASLTKKVTESKADILADIKAVKAKTKAEKKTKDDLISLVNNLVVAKDVNGLVNNLKALDNNINSLKSLKATIAKRVASAKKSSAVKAKPATKDTSKPKSSKPKKPAKKTVPKKSKPKPGIDSDSDDSISVYF